MKPEMIFLTMISPVAELVHTRVNRNHISFYFKKKGQNTEVVFTNQASILVTETPEQIDKLMKEKF